MTFERESLIRQLDAITARLAAIDALPEEPLSHEPAVIYFQMQFCSGETHTCQTIHGKGRPCIGCCTTDKRTFTYAAVRCAENGRWYTTGARSSPQGYTWDQLAQWLLIDNKVVGGIWLATDLEQLA